MAVEKNIFEEAEDDKIEIEAGVAGFVFEDENEEDDFDLDEHGEPKTREESVIEETPADETIEDEVADLADDESVEDDDDFTPKFYALEAKFERKLASAEGVYRTYQAANAEIAELQPKLQQIEMALHARRAAGRPQQEIQQGLGFKQDIERKIAAAQKRLEEVEPKLTTEADELKTLKESLEAEKSRGRGDGYHTPMARAWGKKNGWFSPKGGDPKSDYALEVAGKLVEKGYDPAKPAFYIELGRQARVKFAELREPKPGKEPAKQKAETQRAETQPAKPKRTAGQTVAAATGRKVDAPSVGKIPRETYRQFREMGKSDEQIRKIWAREGSRG